MHRASTRRPLFVHWRRRTRCDPLLSGGEPVKSCVSMAGVLPPCRVPVRRPTTKPKRRPTLVAGLPIRKYLTQMKRPHLKYANAPRQARRKRGRREGREGRRRYVHSCCAELHFRKAAAANAGGSPRVSQCSAVSGEVSPATSTNLDLDLSPGWKEEERTGGSGTDGGC